jgi:uncharacterized membrane protein YozB (DUF420 family)
VTTADLPALNACLNATSAVLLILGFTFIRKKRIVPHAWCMSLAVVISALFLVGYITHKIYHGTTVFVGPPLVRTIYLAILLTHTVLAAVIVPLVLITLYRAVRSQFTRHVKIARWTLPIWLYVSVTGVVIYFMLYRLSDSVQIKESGLRKTANVLNSR